jgi:hypothetical protein
MEPRLDRIEKAVEAMLLGISELKDSQQKTDSQILELKESQKKTDSQILELKESQQKTDEQMRRTDAKLDRIGKQLADLGLVQGEVAEELFYRNLRSLFRKRYSSAKRSLPFTKLITSIRRIRLTLQIYPPFFLSAVRVAGLSAVLVAGWRIEP